MSPVRQLAPGILPPEPPGGPLSPFFHAAKRPIRCLPGLISLAILRCVPAVHPGHRHHLIAAPHVKQTDRQGNPV